MKAHPLLLLIPILALLAAATTVAALETRRTPDWQAALDSYIAELAATGSPAIVERVAHAGRPDRFMPSMGHPVSDQWQWQIEQLPHPPQELYCVLLRQTSAPDFGGGDEPVSQIVYVAYLSDALYRAGWIVYAGPRSPFPTELPGRLAAVGCELDSPAGIDQ